MALFTYYNEISLPVRVRDLPIDGHSNSVRCVNLRSGNGRKLTISDWNDSCYFLSGMSVT